MILNVTANFVETYGFSIFWVYVIVPVDDLNTKKLIWKFTLSLVNVMLEIFLMCFTADNIDFRGYLYALMAGRGKLKLFPEVSIFLIHKKAKERVMTFRSNSQMPNEVDFIQTFLSKRTDDEDYEDSNVFDSQSESDITNRDY
jgi:hypothetical protein